MSDERRRLDRVWEPPGLKRWLQEPLLHFMLAGLALFIIYGALRDPSPTDNLERIELTADDVRRLEVAWAARWRRPPTQAELQGLIEEELRQEILYREALALGLDKGDTIVKRRLAQKMEFLSEDVAAIREPTAAELKTWFEEHQRQFADPPRADFRHVFFSFDRRGARAEEDARRALPRLASRWPASAADPQAGDPFMFQDYYRDSTPEHAAKVFGPTFAGALFRLRPGSWQGPIESGYGWHLVWVDSLTPGRLPSFDEVEPAVKSEWQAEQRAEARRKSYEALRDRYEIVVQRPDSSEEEAKAVASVKEASR
jgi:hypothetical protein